MRLAERCAGGPVGPRGRAAVRAWRGTINRAQSRADFTSKRIVDAKNEIEALLCLSLDSRQGVDTIVEKAVLAGGKADPGPQQDHGFMYGRSFEDLDGHVFEPVWMNVEAAMAAMGRRQTETA
jgi:hypothetical protein